MFTGREGQRGKSQCHNAVHSSWIRWGALPSAPAALGDKHTSPDALPIGCIYANSLHRELWGFTQQCNMRNLGYWAHS